MPRDPPAAERGPVRRARPANFRPHWDSGTTTALRSPGPENWPAGRVNPEGRMESVSAYLSGRLGVERGYHSPSPCNPLSHATTAPRGKHSDAALFDSRAYNGRLHVRQRDRHATTHDHGQSPQIHR